MKAILEEVRRTWRLTMGAEARTAIRKGRSHPGWMADPHLRKGFFTAVPIFVGAAALFLASFAVTHSFALYFAFVVPAAILCNVVWFAVAARSRAKG